MIEKINLLKSTTSNNEVIALCESAVAALTSTLYTNVTFNAKKEIENSAMSHLFEELAKIDDKAINEWLENAKRVFYIDNLGVREAINSINENEGRMDPTLQGVTEKWGELLQSNPEYMIAEEFVSGMQSFSYYPRIGGALAAIKDRIDSYSMDIDIKKILEAMKGTKSAFIIPIIERHVENYLNEKNEQTKSSLRHACLPFTFDPMVRDLVNAVSVDATNLQLEYANAQCDIEKIYSPLLYLGENEVVFNIKGTYYVKKGNNVNRLPKTDREKLDKEFTSLCEAINSPYVDFSRKAIKIYVGNDTATLTEGKVLVNDKEMDEGTWKSAVETSKLIGNGDFFDLVGSLAEHYNDIAEVDFVKRVFLKENEHHSADVFKLRDNVFITVHNPELGKSTFYRNVNPMQAKNLMMEHLRYDVSKTFKDVLPQEEKIMSDIKETKQSYVNYINQINENISKFENEVPSETTSKVLEALKEELAEMKNEFKDYLNRVENYLRTPGEEVDVTNEEVSVEINVDGKKYTVPIPDQQAGKADNGPEAAEDEAGTEVGAEFVEEPASAVTFDEDESELLGDSPSIQDDEIDLGGDEAEAEADEVEAEADAEAEEKDVEAEEEAEDDELLVNDEVDKEEEDEAAEEDDLLDFGEEEETEFEDDEVEKEKKKREEEKKAEESSEGKGLKKAKFLKEDGEVEKPKKKSLFDKKKKANESLNESASEQLNEAQVGNEVMIDGKRGNITGQTSDGQFIVQIQGSTEFAKANDLKVIGGTVETVKPPYKFDEKTQKVLFEQFVKCGIFVGNTPVKTNNCFVKYSQFKDANDDDKLNVIVEGQLTMLPKNEVKLLEDENSFANPEEYIEGALIDETTEEVVENVLVNAIDYTNALGDAQQVRIIRNYETEPTTDSAPKAIVRTLAV